MRLSWFIANRIGKKKTKLSGIGNIIAITSVTISVVIILLSMAISNGFRKEIKEKALAFSGDATISPLEGFNYRDAIEETNSDEAPEAFEVKNTGEINDLRIENLKALSQIETLPFVKNVVGISLKPGMMKTDDQIQGIVLEGVPDNFDWSVFEGAMIEGCTPNASGKEKTEEIIEFSAIQKSDLQQPQEHTQNQELQEHKQNQESQEHTQNQELQNQQPQQQLLISERIAKMMELKTGEDALLYFIVNEGIKVRKFTVCGIYSLQFEEFDKTYLFTTKEIVNELNGWSKNASSLFIVNYTDHSDSQMEERRNAIVREIYQKFQKDDQPLNIQGLQESLGGLFDWLRLLDSNVLIILILMILVAGFNMVSSLLIILFENISKIGVLKTLGMKNSGIKQIFLAKSSRIVIYGILLGNVIAVTICLIQKYLKVFSLNPDSYFLDAVPINLSIWNVIGIDCICFVAIMIILLIPCHLISKISPSKTIKVV